MNPKIRILGIVNLTDDSYYAPSRVGSCDALIERVGQMVAEGMDIVDIGACSTRPGSRPVGAEEEWRRLGPALQALRRRFRPSGFHRHLLVIRSGAGLRPYRPVHGQ